MSEINETVARLEGLKAEAEKYIYTGTYVLASQPFNILDCSNMPVAQCSSPELALYLNTLLTDAEELFAAAREAEQLRAERDIYKHALCEIVGTPDGFDFWTKASLREYARSVLENLYQTPAAGEEEYE